MATDNLGGFFSEPPEEIKQENERLAALAALHRSRERRALQMKAKLENAHLAKLVAVIRDLNMQWMTENEFRGMLGEQKEKVAAKPDYRGVWRERGEMDVK
jgi:hypothetical protein